MVGMKRELTKVFDVTELANALERWNDLRVVHLARVWHIRCHVNAPVQSVKGVPTSPMCVCARSLLEFVVGTSCGSAGKIVDRGAGPFVDHVHGSLDSPKLLHFEMATTTATQWLAVDVLQGARCFRVEARSATFRTPRLTRQAGYASISIRHACARLNGELCTAAVPSKGCAFLAPEPL